MKSLMQKAKEDIHTLSYLERAMNMIFAQLEDGDQKYKDMPAHKGMKLFREHTIAA